MALASIVAAAVVVALVLYWKKMYLLIRERMRLINYVEKIPGPYSIPILGTTWQFKWNIAGLAMQLRDWGHHYASEGHGLVKFWLAMRPMVGCIRPETAKLVLERNDIITKGAEYNILMPWLGTGLLISTGRSVTPVIFLEQLEKFAASGKEFDMFPFVKRYCVDLRSNITAYT
ncbi:hypothetical protein ANCCEY_03595 [Ancylostoma ceylanicum]|uniref:Cytochrome P450 n=1 Tax=Ancylostoma ceylanicum TaxID=53326 RepID=A0A0D6M1H3_9BILA|nr:hypothetical protein ANCCEY_03595 [Ancylostoma ceylanicum]